MFHHHLDDLTEKHINEVLFFFYFLLLTIVQMLELRCIKRIQQRKKRLKFQELTLKFYPSSFWNKFCF